MLKGLAEKGVDETTEMIVETDEVEFVSNHNCLVKITSECSDRSNC